MRLIEEGVSLAPIARATGLDVVDLAALPVARRAVVATGEELGQMATMLAYRTLEEGLRILDEGNESLRLRLVTSVAGHPLRRMQTDMSKQLGAMTQMLDRILEGGEVIEDEDVVDDEPEGGRGR